MAAGCTAVSDSLFYWRGSSIFNDYCGDDSSFVRTFNGDTAAISQARFSVSSRCRRREGDRGRRQTVEQPVDASGRCRQRILRSVNGDG